MVRVSIHGILYELMEVGDLYTWKMVGCTDSILMDEYLREEIERGIKAYKEEQRRIPKGYTVHFPGKETTKK